MELDNASVKQRLEAASAWTIRWTSWLRKPELGNNGMPRMKEWREWIALLAEIDFRALYAQPGIRGLLLESVLALQRR